MTATDAMPYSMPTTAGGDNRAKSGAFGPAPTKDDADRPLSPTARLSAERDLPLLTRVTRLISDEMHKAGSRITADVTRLRDSVKPESRPVPGMSTFAAAAVAALGAMLTLTPLRRYATPDHFSTQTQTTIFLLASIAAVIPALLRLTPKEPVWAQVYLICLAPAVVSTVSAVIVWRSGIPDNNSPGAALVVAALAAVGISALAMDAHVPLLGPLEFLSSRAAVAATMAVYAFGLIVLSVNRGALSEPAEDALVPILVTCASVPVAVEGLRRVMRRRNQRLFETWAESVDTAIDRCEAAAARTDMLSQLRSHWLSTAAVVSRMVHHPHGTGPGAAEAKTPEPAVSKLIMHDLRLAQSSGDSLVGSVASHMFPRGWLYQQYRRNSEHFAESEARRRGGTAAPEALMPEHCTYRGAESGPPAHGPRRDFCDMVYAGGYDHQTRSDTDSAMERAMRDALSSDAVRVHSPLTGDTTLDAILRELIPTGPSVVPPALLPPTTAGPLEVGSYVWLPDNACAADGSGAVLRPSDIVPAEDRMMFHAVRVDVSEPASWERLRPAPQSSAPSERLPGAPQAPIPQCDHRPPTTAPRSPTVQRMTDGDDFMEEVCTEIAHALVCSECADADTVPEFRALAGRPEIRRAAETAARMVHEASGDDAAAQRLGFGAHLASWAEACGAAQLPDPVQRLANDTAQAVAVELRTEWPDYEDAAVVAQAASFALVRRMVEGSAYQAAIGTLHDQLCDIDELVRTADDADIHHTVLSFEIEDLGISRYLPPLDVLDLRSLIGAEWLSGCGAVKLTAEQSIRAVEIGEQADFGTAADAVREALDEFSRRPDLSAVGYADYLRWLADNLDGGHSRRDLMHDWADSVQDKVRAALEAAAGTADPALVEAALTTAIRESMVYTGGVASPLIAAMDAVDPQLGQLSSGDHSRQFAEIMRGSWTH